MSEAMEIPESIARKVELQAARRERTGAYVPDYGEVETAFHEFASWLETESPGEYPEAPEFQDWMQAMHAFRIWYDLERRAWKAEGWDEGFCAGVSEGISFQSGSNSAHTHPTADINPYRESGEA